MTHDLTRLVHHGEPDDETGALGIPLVNASAFGFPSAEEAAARYTGDDGGYKYVRRGNPTVRSLEEKIMGLEGGEDAVALSSGMAAVHAALTCGLESGDHIVCPKVLYGETSRLIRERLPRFGITATRVDTTDLSAIEAALTPETQIIYVETPANPTLAITDLRAVASIARARKVRLVVDGTFATPWHQKPLELGAGVVVHSATKALCGHGDAAGGVVVGSAELVSLVREEAVRSLGAVIAPNNAWLIARGMQTLGLRMTQASASAQVLAQRLERSKRIARVYYPGLAAHPGHETAVAQMTRGFGSMLAFDVAGGLDAARNAYDALGLISRAVNLGDVRSLLTHPASTTHQSMTGDARAAAGIGEGLMRLSVGIEDVEDLWGDLEQALG